MEIASVQAELICSELLIGWCIFMNDLHTQGIQGRLTSRKLMSMLSFPRDVKRNINCLNMNKILLHQLSIH